MRFLFVDKITAIAGNQITGQKTFKKDDPMRFTQTIGEEVITPGVVSEAIGQLVSWLAIERNKFTGRPVFLFADNIEILGPVLAGSQVRLEAEIEEMNEETLVFSGAAYVGDLCVHRVKSCSGYFMPLGELEDPGITRKRFEFLTSSAGLHLDDDGKQFDFDILRGNLVARPDEKTVIVDNTIPRDAPFYADHFPRFPVTPIVMINEMVGLATQYLLPENSGLKIHHVKNIKIRDFIKPGESCSIKITVLEQ